VWIDTNPITTRARVRCRITPTYCRPSSCIRPASCLPTRNVCSIVARRDAPGAAGQGLGRRVAEDVLHLPTRLVGRRHQRVIAAGHAHRHAYRPPPPRRRPPGGPAPRPQPLLMQPVATLSRCLQCSLGGVATARLMIAVLLDTPTYTSLPRSADLTIVHFVRAAERRTEPLLRCVLPSVCTRRAQ
jgi:hypothetical protein